MTNYTLRPGKQGKYNTMNYDRTKVGGGGSRQYSVSFLPREQWNATWMWCRCSNVHFLFVFFLLPRRFTLPTYTTALLCGCVGVSVCSIYKYIAAADAAVLMTGIKYLQRSLKGPFSRAVSLSLSLSRSLATEGFSCRPTTLVARRRPRVPPATG